MWIFIKIINFIESKIELSKFYSYDTTIFNILDTTTELWMTKYIIGEFFSSDRATLYKNPSEQTVTSGIMHFCSLTRADDVTNAVVVAEAAASLNSYQNSTFMFNFLPMGHPI